MKILIYGAGVIGSVYATRLHEANFNITLLARGKRFKTLEQGGLITKDALTRKQTTYNIPLVQQLAPADFYDLIILAVRYDQIATVLPVLKKNTVSPLILFMLNNPDNMGQWVDDLPEKHIILGFPGVGGIYQGNVIEFILIKQQKTTIGEVNGELSAITQKIKTLFEKAGFKTDISVDMQSWLKIHALFVSCVAAAIIKENGNSVQLGKKKGSVERMVKSIREGFTACKALGMPIKPTNLKIIFMIMPTWFSILYWQNAMQGKMGTLSMAPHANAAKAEMQLLSKKVLTLVHSSSIATPTLDQLLLGFINSK